MKSVLELIKQVPVHALSHITGGGFWENIPRVLPKGAKAVIDGNSWEWPVIFDWLKENGNVSMREMYRTFNCGVGMVIAVPHAEAERAVELLNQLGEDAWVIGRIADAAENDEQVEILADETR